MSSEYWVGSENDVGFDDIDIGELVDAFKEHDVPILVKLMGDIISRKIIKIIFQY